jgi:hypothetical protein
VTAIALVGCGSAKRQMAGCQARNLYTSTYFSQKRVFAETLCDGWYILSAKHGLLDPLERIGYYDVSLEDFSITERYQWGHDVLDELVDQEAEGSTVILLAGRTYVDVLPDGLEERFDVRDPFAETSGIGEQNAWLSQAVKRQDPFLPVAEVAGGGGDGGRDDRPGARRRARGQQSIMEWSR